MKKLLIISIGITMLMMFSCGKNTQREARQKYHKEIYETTLHLSSLEAEDILNNNDTAAFFNEKTFITRHRTTYGGYTPPIFYRWYNDKEGYRPAFVLSYNPKEFSKICFEDKERFFPHGAPDNVQKELTYTGK